MYNTDLPDRAELPSSGQLLRSTAVAALIAAGLLVTTVLPAEYGIDPTGVGGALGLTSMGEMKVSLAKEANAGEGESTHEAGAAEVSPTDEAPASPFVSGLFEHGHDHGDDHGHGHDHAPATEAASVAVVSSEPAPATQATAQQHTTTVTLKPGESAEIKLAMRKDSRVSYEWSTAGGKVNYDTHGDPDSAPKGFYHGYGKGRNATGDTGTLQAAFDGKHGWFWRNRSAAAVTITLKTEGDYAQIHRVL